MIRNKAYIVGVGPGSPGYLTADARVIVKEADIVVSWEMNLLPVKSLISDQKVYLQEAHNYIQIAREAAAEAREKGKNIVVLKIGDPCISSGLAITLEILRDFEVKIVPGISSTQMAAAAARINLDESALITFHESEDGLEEKQKFMVEAFRLNRHLIILTGQAHKPCETARYLISNGVSDATPALVCENLTLDNEKIFRGTLKDVIHEEFSWLSVMVVKQGEAK